MMVMVHIPNDAQNTPSRLPLMLVSGNRASLSSRTTSVRVSNVGNSRVNFVICPGYHDGGTGSDGNGMLFSAGCIIQKKRVDDLVKCCLLVNCWSSLAVQVGAQQGRLGVQLEYKLSEEIVEDIVMQ